MKNNNPQQEYMDRAAGFSYYEEESIHKQNTLTITGACGECSVYPLFEKQNYYISEPPNVRLLIKKDGSKVLQCAVKTFSSDGHNGYEWVDVPEVEE